MNIRKSHQKNTSAGSYFFAFFSYFYIYFYDLPFTLPGTLLLSPPNPLSYSYFLFRNHKIQGKLPPEPL